MSVVPVSLSERACMHAYARMVSVRVLASGSLFGCVPRSVWVRTDWVECVRRHPGPLTAACLKVITVLYIHFCLYSVI